MYSSLAQSIKPVVQRRVDQQVQMHALIQRTFRGEGTQAIGNLESRLNASKGGGSALAPEVRAFMEPRFGSDFTSVRVHTGGEAVQMNQELGAQAFTHGSDIYFGPGKSPGNNELTAHELTHVVQQTGIIQRKPAVSRYLQISDYLQTQTAPTGGPNPNCLRVLGEILSFLFGGLTHTIDGVTLNGVNLHRGLIERWQDLNNDPRNLYQNHRTRAQAHPQYGSWEGHQDQYRDQQRGLRDRIRQWVRNNCDDPNNSGGLPQGWRNVITNARRWVTNAPPSQPSTFVQQPPEPSLPTLIPAFVLAAAAARGIARTVLWSRFWQAVISRFAIRGAAAATLSLADGPLPVGEILSLGIAIWTVWDIYQAWDDLWGQTITEA
jgi:hypothetical protein